MVDAMSLGAAVVGDNPLLSPSGVGVLAGAGVAALGAFLLNEKMIGLQNGAAPAASRVPLLGVKEKRLLPPPAGSWRVAAGLAGTAAVAPASAGAVPWPGEAPTLGAL